MDELVALEGRWNDQIENFKAQAKKREQEYLQIISERDKNMELERNLESEIPLLEKELEITMEQIAKIEHSPNFIQNWNEYCRKKEQVAKQKENEKQLEWTQISVSFQKAVDEFDIEKAQLLLDKLRLLDEPRSEQLKEKLIEMFKKL